MNENIGFMQGRLKEKAFKQIRRSDFVSDEAETIAYFDVALPIGYGQTISQPSTVEKMLEWLDVSPGQKIMDVGSGSGWTTALLASFVGPKGRVYAVERIPELVRFGRTNCEKYGFDNTEFYQAGDVVGLPLFSPFDRILVGASPLELPRELITQLRTGGKMVIPVRNDILEITKLSDVEIELVTHPGYTFVPLI